MASRREEGGRRKGRETKAPAGENTARLRLASKHAVACLASGRLLSSYWVPSSILARDRSLDSALPSSPLAKNALLLSVKSNKSKSGLIRTRLYQCRGEFRFSRQCLQIGFFFETWVLGFPIFEIYCTVVTVGFWQILLQLLVKTQ